VKTKEAYKTTQFHTHIVGDETYIRKGQNNYVLKVNKIENFVGFDFEFYTVSLLVVLKYEGFVTNNF
jgi:hypothetical protein